MGYYLKQPRLIIDTAAGSHVAQDQCDCACETTISSISLPVPDASHRYQTLSPAPFLPLQKGFVAATYPGTGVVLLNDSAVSLFNHFNTPRFLGDIPVAWSNTWGRGTVQGILQQMVSLGLLVPQTYTSLPVAETSTVLSAWLHITDRCNLRCTYCYLPHRPQNMAPETGQLALEAICRSAINHHYPKIKLKYAGGEPLLRFWQIATLHQYAQKLTTRCNLDLEGWILSNGTLLTAQLVRTMRNLNLRLSISLDGLAPAHNRQRLWANGRGSFADTVYAINLAQTHGLVPNISITVSGRTAAALPDFIGWITEQDLPFSLNFYRENSYSMDSEGLRLEEEPIITGMLAAFKVIETNLPSRSLLATLVDRANLAAPHHRTCGVGHNYLVFDPQGRIAKCQMDIGHSCATIHADDPLAHIRADQRGIQNLSVEKKEDCRNCCWKYWCTGGCPLATYRATGQYNVKSPLCNIYQALFPEVIRLEGLRLLKYGGVE